MDKKTIKIALILVLVTIIIVAAFLVIEKTTSFELRLNKAMDYEEILFRLDEYALVRIDSDSVAFVCNPRADESVPSWNKPFSMYAEFDLTDHSLVEEYYIARTLGPFANSFIVEADREHYVYSRHSSPTYSFYLGISSMQPGEETVGKGVEQLQYIELNGLYYFMFGLNTDK